MRIFPGGRVESGNHALVLDHCARNGEPVIVSHAHADHTVRKGRIFSSPETALLLKTRYGVQVAGSLDYGQPFRMGEMKVTLFPSGHILGSSQVLVETPETSLLYSGDIKLRPGYSCSPIEIPRAENLIIEATFGNHRYQWPNKERIEKQVFDFIDRARSQGRTPVFLAYSLGKSQEVLALLARRRIPAAVSRTVFDMCKVYEEFGIDLGDYELYDNQQKLPGALVIPSQKAKHINLTSPAFAVVSGWALRRRNGDLTQIPLSDHADFGELLRYTDKVKPKKVWTTHGYAEELASALRHRGYQACELDKSLQDQQLSLT